MHIDIDRDMYTHMYIHTYIPTYSIHTHIYIYMLIYIYICMYHSPSLPLSLPRFLCPSMRGHFNPESRSIRRLLGASGFSDVPSVWRGWHPHSRISTRGSNPLFSLRSSWRVYRRANFLRIGLGRDVRRHVLAAPGLGDRGFESWFVGSPLGGPEPSHVHRAKVKDEAAALNQKV